MAVPLIYVVVAGGRVAYSFLRTPAGRKAAQEFAKNLVKRGKNAKVTNSKPPDVKITQGPRRLDPKKPNQPVNPKTGKFQKPNKPPAPKKPSGPPKADGKPKVDRKPPASVKSKPKNVTKTGPKKPKQRPMKDVTPSNIKLRNDPKIRGRKPMTLAPAAVRIATVDLDVTPVEKKVSKKKPRRRPTTKDKTDRKFTPPNVQPKKKPKTTKKPKKTVPNKRPKPSPLTGVKEFRRKSLKSDRIGTDAGDGMVWIVGSNTNAFVRVKPSDPRVKKQKEQRKILKSMK
jgi:hypothetical protein|tara:strand:- start:410 stop:1264 length:855 start_codon:yes stop_codon:yes gene_type:complete